MLTHSFSHEVTVAKVPDPIETSLISKDYLLRFIGEEKVEHGCRGKRNRPKLKAIDAGSLRLPPALFLFDEEFGFEFKLIIYQLSFGSIVAIPIPVSVPLDFFPWMTFAFGGEQCLNLIFGQRAVDGVGFTDGKIRK